MEAVTAINWQRETIVTSESEAAIDLNPFWKQLGESGIHLTTLTNSTIWAKFRMTIDSLSDGRTRQGNGRALFRWKIRLHMSRSVLGLVNSCNETLRMLADNLFHSNICPLLPFGFLLIFFLHLCHLIRQLPKSRSSFFLSSLPPHPGLPERFQLFQLFEIAIGNWFSGPCDKCHMTYYSKFKPTYNPNNICRTDFWYLPGKANIPYL